MYCNRIVLYIPSGASRSALTDINLINLATVNTVIIHCKETTVDMSDIQLLQDVNICVVRCPNAAHDIDISKLPCRKLSLQGFNVDITSNVQNELLDLMNCSVGSDSTIFNDMDITSSNVYLNNCHGNELDITDDSSMEDTFCHIVNCKMYSVLITLEYCMNVLITIISHKTSYETGLTRTSISGKHDFSYKSNGFVIDHGHHALDVPKITFSGNVRVEQQSEVDLDELNEFSEL